MLRSLLAIAVASVVLSSHPNQSDAKPVSYGTIRGVVTFKGKAPVRKKLNRSSDPVCAKVTKLEEDVVVTAGKLRDVHVRLSKDAKVGKPDGSMIRKSRIINQSSCMYEPRVTGVVPGQAVVIKNVDPTYHNVHARKGRRTKFNLPQPKGAADIVKRNLSKPGEVINLGCDVHPWMKAFVVTWPHAFFDITKADGAFTLHEVPSGEYTLEAWHPKLGLRSKRVTLRPGKNEINFEFGG